MNRSSYGWMWVANALVAGTGLMYGWMRYFTVPSDPYAMVNHTWQPHLQHAHIIVAPLLVFMIGQFWVAHARPYLQAACREGRRSGIGLLGLAGVMILSGYFLQTAVAPLWRSLCIGIHGFSSLLWIALLLAHLLTHRRPKKPRSSPETPDSLRIHS